MQRFVDTLPGTAGQFAKIGARGNFVQVIQATGILTFVCEDGRSFDAEEGWSGVVLPFETLQVASTQADDDVIINTGVRAKHVDQGTTREFEIQEVAWQVGGGGGGSVESPERFFGEVSGTNETPPTILPVNGAWNMDFIVANLPGGYITFTRSLDGVNFEPLPLIRTNDEAMTFDGSLPNEIGPGDTFKYRGDVTGCKYVAVQWAFLADDVTATVKFAGNYNDPLDETPYTENQDTVEVPDTGDNVYTKTFYRPPKAKGAIIFMDTPDLKASATAMFLSIYNASRQGVGLYNNSYIENPIGGDTRSYLIYPGCSGAAGSLYDANIPNDLPLQFQIGFSNALVVGVVTITITIEWLY